MLVDHNGVVDGAALAFSIIVSLIPIRTQINLFDLSDFSKELLDKFRINLPIEVADVD